MFASLSSLLRKPPTISEAYCCKDGRKGRKVKYRKSAGLSICNGEKNQESTKNFVDKGHVSFFPKNYFTLFANGSVARNEAISAKWLLDWILILSPYKYWLHFMQRSHIGTLLLQSYGLDRKQAEKG